MLALLAALPSAAQPAASPDPDPLTLTQRERLAPAASSLGTLVSEGLGFALEAPEGMSLVQDDAIVTELMRRAGPAAAARMAIWRWQNDPPTRMLMLSIGSLHPHSVEVFDRYVDRQLQNFVAGGVQVIENRRVGEFERAIRGIGTQTGAILYMRALGFTRGGRFLVLSVSSTTVGSTALDAVVDSAHVSP